MQGKCIAPGSNDHMLKPSGQGLEAHTLHVQKRVTPNAGAS